ncbi:CopG family ribbon-helix-helix protein [Sphingomonas immobilis]|uniref:Ribbon-helix-helix protein, CopG family n=1 Tax=Sphingomonas immobilis TaxID=3063997 RepID=A0ABT8ZTH6_9SPHN|nr:ribbon-helix-helix protein, CopG family [Sphingomonas sp. CA1-15]MDO7840868.1 ribbon-helix-helix protein, CopG family [Sphingomonas sp. CA1-15]
MTAPTKALTAHVPLDLADQVDALASRQKRSREWVIEQALAAWIEREEEWHRMTLEGLADVDAGRTIDHERVKAWAASLSTDNPLPLPTV